MKPFPFKLAPSRLPRFSEKAPVVCGLLLVVAVGAGTSGFLAGRFAAEFTGADAIKPDTDNVGRDKTRRHGGERSSVADAYRAEMIAVSEAIERNMALLREKQLTLQIMDQRRIDPDSPTCRRLRRETEELQSEIGRLRRHLGVVRELLSKLTTRQNVHEHWRSHLDDDTEIAARRMLMEQDAGLPTE